MRHYLGIDWGGTYIKAGLVDERGRLLRKESFVSRDLRDKEAFIANVAGLAARLSRYKITALGVGVPGPVNVNKGFLYSLPNVPGWQNFPLARKLAQKVKLPVFLENDANLFALAEAVLGAGQRAGRMLFFTLGTGLGSSFVYNGKILSGETSSLELAHVPIALGGKKCGCGANGCIETYVGANYLLDKYARIKRCARPAEVKTLYRAALAGDKAAIAVWDDFAVVFGKFLGGMVNIFNPQMIVLGGGVAGALPVFKARLMAAIKAQAMPPQFKGLKLFRTGLKESGVIGAALLAAQKTA